ncbi:MAG: DUF1549 domain-containing protein, partial [Planctomycetaceae bacterium]|nr:DUF1549 domain-containing protein [Planctomycetaceae bacterium]
MSAPHVQAMTADIEGEQFFTDKIEPLLKAHCLECHSHAADEMSGGLTLDSRSGWSTGGEHGPVIVPEKPEESLLIKAIRHDDPTLRMPPDEKLSAASIELLVEWIRRGAPDPRQTPVKSKPDGDPLDWWSLRPLIRPELPGSADTNPIDHFILQELERRQLTPVPEADRRTLIRRVYIDLHGLPPEPDAVTAFVADPDPEAYEKLVDQLLTSERYGERW